MALNFPNSPADGDTYEDFYWDATAGIWRRQLTVTEVDDLDDVDATSPSGDDILIYNASSGNWESGNVNNIVTIPEPEPPLPVAFLTMGA